MRWQILTAGALTAVAALPASAQFEDGHYRRFTEDVTDVNRNNKIVYAPLGWSFRGARPASMPFSVSVASWYQQSAGAANVKPDNVRDEAEYRLERFETVKDGGNAMFRVTITRTPAPPEGQAPPELRLVHTDTLITSRDRATVETTPNGVRYQFYVRSPQLTMAPRGESSREDADRYELRLMPAREVNLPRYITRAPTFGGEDPMLRMHRTPPQLPLAERVAGRRIEYRNFAVVEGQSKVAGKRQEQRLK